MDGRIVRRLFGAVTSWSLIWLSTACTGQVPAPPTVNPEAGFAATGTSAPTTFTDPFAYCASVGTLDTPDARYVGTPVPDAIINGYKQAAGLQSSTEPLDVFRKTTIWRCMGGKVVVCNFGANLPCDSKANTDKTPSPEMSDFCKANPDSDIVPMSVTGHDTLYNWRCTNGSPEILNQIDQADAQGYLQRIWYPIEQGK